MNRLIQPSVIGDTENVVNRWPAEVGVNQQHAPFVRGAERQGEVDDRERLPFLRDGAGYHHPVEPLLALQMVQRSRETLVLLDRRRGHSLASHELTFVSAN